MGKIIDFQEYKKSDYGMCPECGEEHFLSQPCGDIFRVTIPEIKGKWIEFRSNSWIEATEKSCNIIDSMFDYCISKKEGIEDMIIVDSEGNTKKVSVKVLFKPIYETTIVEEIDADGHTDD